MFLKTPEQAEFRLTLHGVELQKEENCNHNLFIQWCPAIPLVVLFTSSTSILLSYNKNSLL